MHTVMAYSPRPLQWRFHQTRTRFSVMICHRRFGKTVAAINDLLRQAVRDGRSDFRGAYMAPYVGQVKAVAWDYLKHYAGVIPHVKFVETELRCDLPTGARIRLFGTDNANALRGMYLDDVVLDEPADMHPEVWTRIVRPMLADRQGRALFVGTPNGTNNLLHDVWSEAQREPPQGELSQWSHFMFRASETGYLPAEELAAAQRSMTPEDYAQEFECSFAAAVKGAYYANVIEQLEAQGRVGTIVHSPHLPVHTAWDLGMDDATAIWFFQVEPSGDWRVFDYYEQSGEGLSHYAQILQSKGYVYGQHFAPHDIRVRELGTGTSRLESAAALGIGFSVAPQLPVVDGVNAVRQFLPRMWFDATRCRTGLHALRNYRREWRARHEVFASSPLHDWTSHSADALRYAVTGYRPTVDVGQAPRKARTEYNYFGGRYAS